MTRRSGLVHVPLPSGPLRFRVARARSRTAGSIPPESIQPAIPHMDVVDGRRQARLREMHRLLHALRLTGHEGKGYINQATASAPTTRARNSLTKSATLSLLSLRHRRAK